MIQLKITSQIFFLDTIHIQISANLIVRALDYTTVVVSGRVGFSFTGLTTPVGWQSLPQLIVLSRSAAKSPWIPLGTLLILKRYCTKFGPISEYDRKNRSTEGCSKLKSPETRQVQERLVSTLEHLQVPKWDRTRCPEEKASSVGMPHPLQMFYENLLQLGKKSNSVIRSRLVIGSKIGVMPD